ncbi:MAG: DUF4886 domain-containing protein [Oscillospiraceae bacterium]|nr:DUF4886 domain-containing protein [Oscillospiraceae bacterium]
MTETVGLWKQKQGRVCRVLMIGNSFCMLYAQELYGMAKSVGIEARIVSVVAAACTLEKHWNWLQNGEKNYTVQIVDREGLRQLEGMGLEDSLALDRWDVISCQDGEHYYRLGGLLEAEKHTEPYLGGLVAFVRSRFPAAVHCFHQVWAYQVGYNRPEKSPFRVPDRDMQLCMHRDLRSICCRVCREYGLFRVPSGDAWELARQDVRVGDTLCMPDCEHDGESEGGRYLNACVWFEALFGISCIGNAYRPAYPLAEDKIAALQQAAHTAMAAARSEEKENGCGGSLL